MNTRYAIEEQFQSILDEMEKESSTQKSLDLLELNVFKQLLLLGKMILSYLIRLRSSKYEIPNTITTFENSTMRRVVYVFKGKSKYTYLSIFGSIEIHRKRYYSSAKKHSIFPLDQMLNLPSNGVSYQLQSWLGESSCKQTYKESVSLLNKIFSVGFSGMHAHRINESIYQGSKNLEVPVVEIPLSEDYFVCCSLDGKGIPLKASETDRAVESSANQIGKGKRKGIRKEVTVSVNHKSLRRKRSAEDVLKSFFDGDQESAKVVEKIEPATALAAKEKHLKGFLEGQKEAVAYGINRMMKEAAPQQKLVVLIDGDKGLKNAVTATSEQLKIQERVTLVLDFVHVTQYVWKAADALFYTNDAARKGWVRSVCKEILEGKTLTVCHTLQTLMEQRKPFGKKLYKSNRKTLQKVLNYFKNHIEMMHYEQYLEQGMPIATGVVESACGYFIGKRLDCNGMRWTRKGAKALIDLRASLLNGQWEERLAEYRINQQKKLYSDYPKIVA